MEIKQTPVGQRPLIEPQGVEKRVDVEKQKAEAQNKLRQNASKDYKVSISDQSKNMELSKAKAFEVASATDPVRHDKVSVLKEKIAKGQYKVDSGRIADGMLKEAIRDHIAYSE